MIEPEPLQQIGRTCVRYRQRKLAYYSGCDYFRLASHPRVIAALQTGVNKYGLNVAASRMTTGNHALYLELEAELARVESLMKKTKALLAGLCARPVLALGPTLAQAAHRTPKLF